MLKCTIAGIHLNFKWVYRSKRVIKCSEKQSMADGGRDERRSISDFAKSSKKYGSTCNHLKRQEHCIKHVVEKSDTLQGIALKYGVTMEQIRRVNRLWTNDSLFLREHLLIPVPLGSAQGEVVVMSGDNSPLSPDEYRSISSEGSVENLNSSIMKESEEHSVHNNDISEKSVNDFLVKIDSSIAKTKSMVKKIEGNSTFREDEDCMFTRRKPYASRLRQAHSVATDDILNPPHAVVMTQGRRVKSSLQRLEREQDEMFEL